MSSIYVSILSYNVNFWRNLVQTMRQNNVTVNNFESPLSGMLCAKFVRNWLTGSKEEKINVYRQTDE